jgi:hypothetical protein
MIQKKKKKKKKNWLQQNMRHFQTFSFSSYEEKLMKKEKLFTISYDLGSFHVVPISVRITGSSFQILKINCTYDSDRAKFYVRCI